MWCEREARLCGHMTSKNDFSGPEQKLAGGKRKNAMAYNIWQKTDKCGGRLSSEVEHCGVNPRPAGVFL